MKIIKNFRFTNNISNLKFIKRQIFHIKQKNIILKIFLKLIYRFHIASKKILFLIKSNFFSFLKKNIKHIFLTDNHWLNGFLSNFNVLKSIYIYKKSFLNLKFKNEINLIINLNKSFSKNEINKSKILSIFFNKNNIKQFYNLKILNKLQINLLFLLIYEILKT